MDDLSNHWDSAYQKGADSRSWFQAEAATSLAFIQQVSDSNSHIADVGGGASMLVDSLLEREFDSLTVVDLSEESLKIARKRIGKSAQKVSWEVADALEWQPRRAVNVWHDRAVFHFLVSDEEREEYSRKASEVVSPGGHIIVGGFSLDGPSSCSGLPVRGASTEQLKDHFRQWFRPVSSFYEVHKTPSCSSQEFSWLLAQRLACGL